MVYSTRRKPKMHHFQREAGEKAPNQPELRSQSLAGVDTAWAWGLVNRCSQCAHFPASFSLKDGGHLGRILCWQEKSWISPHVVPLIGETWHRSGHIANCFHKRNWEVVKSQTGWRNMVLYLWEENTRRFVREIFAGYGNSHSSILVPNKPWSKQAPRLKVSWFFPSIASFAMCSKSNYFRGSRLNSLLLLCKKELCYTVYVL